LKINEAKPLIRTLAQKNGRQSVPKGPTNKGLPGGFKNLKEKLKAFWGPLFLKLNGEKSLFWPPE